MRSSIGPLMVLILLAGGLFGAAPLAGAGVCRDCVYGTTCVAIADGFGYQHCVQKQSCKTLCIRFAGPGDACQEWEHFDCVDIGCNLGQACSGFPY
jgi:hypothetical protein